MRNSCGAWLSNVRGETRDMSTAHHLLPPLVEGDRMTREEFLRRWEAMPNLKRAELIDGRVHMPSPLSMDHCDDEAVAIWWLVGYADATPGCRAGSHGTWFMGLDAPQPDSLLRILPEYGGRTRREGIYGSGPPELICEVSYSSVAYDLGPKLNLYQNSGVLEYITHDIREKRIIWRQLVDGRYQTIQPDMDGLLRSRVFPGLWMDVAALSAGDTARVLAVLQQGLASPEHAEFVRRLAAERERRT